MPRQVRVEVSPSVVPLVLGKRSFSAKLLDLAAKRLGGFGNRNERSSRQWHDHAKVSAINLIREGLREFSLSEDELKASRGSERRKVSEVKRTSASRYGDSKKISNGRLTLGSETGLNLTRIVD